MADFSVLTEEFARDAASAGLIARRAALTAGHPVVFIDHMGRYIEERPGGMRFEIRLDPSRPRASHRIVLRELTPDAI